MGGSFDTYWGFKVRISDRFLLGDDAEWIERYYPLSELGFNSASDVAAPSIVATVFLCEDELVAKGNVAAPTKNSGAGTYWSGALPDATAAYQPGVTMLPYVYDSQFLIEVWAVSVTGLESATSAKEVLRLFNDGNGCTGFENTISADTSLEGCEGVQLPSPEHCASVQSLGDFNPKKYYTVKAQASCGIGSTFPPPGHTSFPDWHSPESNHGLSSGGTRHLSQDFTLCEEFEMGTNGVSAFTFVPTNDAECYYTISASFEGHYGCGSTEEILCDTLLTTGPITVSVRTAVSNNVETEAAMFVEFFDSSGASSGVLPLFSVGTLLAQDTEYTNIVDFGSSPSLDLKDLTDVTFSLDDGGSTKLLGGNVIVTVPDGRLIYRDDEVEGKILKVNPNKPNLRVSLVASTYGIPTTQSARKLATPSPTLKSPDECCGSVKVLWWHDTDGSSVDSLNVYTFRVERSDGSSLGPLLSRTLDIQEMTELYDDEAHTVSYTITADEMSIAGAVWENGGSYLISVTEEDPFGNELAVLTQTFSWGCQTCASGDYLPCEDEEGTCLATAGQGGKEPKVVELPAAVSPASQRHCPQLLLAIFCFVVLIFNDVRH
jgi:hypothetical protein